MELTSKMAARAWRVFLDDWSAGIEELDLSGSPATLDEISACLPAGVYTTFRTYGPCRVLPLEQQFRRLEESATLLGLPVALKRDRLRLALHAAAAACPANEKRLRLTVQPGENLAVFVAVEPLRTPAPEDYWAGVATVTWPGARENPKAKSTTFLSFAGGLRRQMPPQMNETLLVDRQGRILEGLSSNFFAILAGEIWTADEEVLSGISRSILLEAAGEAGITVHLRPVDLSQVSDLQEAFLTSASRSVLPIRSIDGRAVGSGKPGPLTRTLIDLYRRLIQSRLEDL